MKFTSESKFLLGILAVTAIVVGAAVWFFSRPTPIVTISKETLIAADSQSLGNKDATNYLVEFSDFQCPACRAYVPAVSELATKYSDKLLIVYRHFPLPQHAYAKQAAYIAEAAGLEGKFWETAKMLFDNQDAFSDEFFSTQFPQFTPNDAIKQKVDRDLNLARMLKISSTPTFFLNGIILKNLFGPQDLVTAVEKVLQ